MNLYKIPAANWQVYSCCHPIMHWRRQLFSTDISFDVCDLVCTGFVVQQAWSLYMCKAHQQSMKTDLWRQFSVIPCQINAINPSQRHCHNVIALLHVSHHNTLFILSCTTSTHAAWLVFYLGSSVTDGVRSFTDTKIKTQMHDTPIRLTQAACLQIL